MNVTVENLAPCRRLVRVEVEPASVESAFEKITSDFQREARFPGFRPGKAPREVVSRTYAKQIEEEVKRTLISENYRKALDEQKLRAIGNPDVEEIQFARGQAFQFAATIEIAPEFEVPDYKGIPVRRENQGVTDADVERAFQVLRERQAAYKDVSRPVQMGDFVVINYSGTSEGKPLTDFAPTARGITQQKNFWVHIATPDEFIPGFSDQLIGAQAGEHRTVNITFPADFVASQLSGKSAVYEVDVVQVKEKSLPELNDALATSYGAENLDKLREGVRRDLQNELEFKQRRAVRNQIVRWLLDKVQFDLPESVVLSETRNVVYDIVRENQERGVPKEAINEQKNEIYNVASNSAKDRIRAAFILGRIADKENIRVTEHELSERILQLAQQNQVKPEKLVKQLRERNGLAQLHEQILTAKVLDYLQLNANVEEVPAGASQPAS